MTTLASAVAIGDNHITIDAPLAAGQVPGFVKVGSELLNVGGQDNRLGTRLVLSSPATATHSQGASVTYAGRPYDAAFLAATAGTGGGAGVTNPVTEPLVVEGQLAETEPSVLLKMTTSEQATETGAALIVRDTEDFTRVAIGDPNESALVVIDPRNSDTPLDGLRVRHGGVNGGAALYTSLGDGDVTIIDRISINASGDGTGAPTFSELPVDLIQAATVFRVLYDGAIVTGQNSAPVDDDLAATQVAMWFDSTNGAAKVKFKGKTADGTVVVGELALA